MRAWSVNSTSGVALIELVILASLLLLVAGLTVPAVNDRVEAEARARALGDLRHLAADVLNYQRDTGRWPEDARFAFTDGPPAPGERAGFGSTLDGTHVSAFLSVNELRVPGWRGPYMSISRADPWGRRYVIVLAGLRGPLSPYGWILSAGRDGVFQTGARDRDLRGDDLGLLLR